jgi:hypothetical protein
MNKLLLALGCAIAMTGSALAGNAEVAATQRPATKAEIAGILEGIRNTLHDPYSIRDAEISGVMTHKDAFGGVSIMVCVRANAKNRYGAYTGKQTYLIHLNNQGRALRANQDMFAQALCRYSAWRPFTEVKQLQNL